MKQLKFSILFLSSLMSAQVDSLQVDDSDSLIIATGGKDSLKIFRPTIQDYRYFKQFSEKKVFDTALISEKTYQFSQYNNRDNFGRIQFANIGSGFNPLGYERNAEQDLSLLPTNKSFGILGIYDVNYYDVKTPTTSFVYHNAVKNGAVLWSTHTQNIGKYFNFAVEYMGLRSQGNYRNSLASNNNVLFSANFKSKNNRYEFFTHYLHQNVNNQEYGGIVRDDLFQAGDGEFGNGQNAQVNLNASNTQYGYRRYYFSHQLTPFNSEKFPFKIRHTLFHQGNKYYYHQSALEPYFYQDAADLTPYALSSKKYSKNFSNTLSLVFDKENFKLDAGVRYQMLRFGLGEPIAFDSFSLPQEVKENRIGAVGNLAIKLWDKIQLNSFLEFSNGREFGTYIKSTNALKFEPIKDYYVDGYVNFQSSYPSFNYLMNASVYKTFNYRMLDAKNETTLQAGGDINLKWFNAKLSASYNRIENMAYFNELGQPMQSATPVDISQIGGEATFNYNKFNLQTQLRFQSVLNNKDLLPMPAFIGRVNLYYQTKAFKNAAEFQGGIKVYYFSEFNSRIYSPIINEFILPGNNGYAIGGKPLVDLYLNMKVKTMMFFIEGQQITTTFQPNKVYTVPRYPFYDFRLNLGIVWRMFH